MELLVGDARWQLERTLSESPDPLIRSSHATHSIVIVVFSPEKETNVCFLVVTSDT